MPRVFIGDLDRVAVLQALYNAQPGRPTAEAEGPDITYEEAEEVFISGSDYLKKRMTLDISTDYVDFVNHRPIRINFDGPLIEVAHYDHDAKDKGLAERVIEELRRQVNE